MKIIGSIKEDLAKEKRISITPETVKQFVDLNFSVLLESKYGEHLGIDDEEYKNKAGEEYIKKTVREMNAEIKRRYKKYTNGKLPTLKNKIVIIVDDGLATGYTMLAAIKYARNKNPKKLIVAIPVAAQDSFEKVKMMADEVICLQTPIFFGAVGSFYQEFSQLEDEEVKYYLEDAGKS